MRLGKAILAVVGATVVLAGLVGTASAGRLSTSSLGMKAVWSRLDFSGGFGTIECEVVVEGSFHERTIAKSVGTLSGFITSATITRCARGGATVLRETLPWHIQYRSFTGTLPNISGISATVISPSFRIREPFGVSCLANRSNVILTFTREASGAITAAGVSGRASCEGIEGELGGSTTNVNNGSGTRVTVTLI